MSNFWSIYKQHQWPEYYLLIAIVLFLIISFVLLILLLISRLKQIKNTKIVTGYIPVIEEILFPMLFNNKHVDEVIASTLYQSYYKYKNFKPTLLENIINLHVSYSGDYNLILEKFYRESGLVNISFKKLKSTSWSVQCQGIRELSQMNVKEAFLPIQKCLNHNHPSLKLEVIVALIKLKGVEGLDILNAYKTPINDWIQLNILYEIDNANLTNVTSFRSFLTSNNPSVVILGLRLIAKFNQVENIDLIKKIIASPQSIKVSDEASKSLSKLYSLGFNDNNAA